MYLVGKLRFFNEYGELETADPGDQVEVLAGLAVGESGAGVLSIVSLLFILFMFNGENVLVFCFCPDGGIWAPGTMVEAAAAVGLGEVPEKTVASMVSSLLMVGSQ